MSRAANAPNPVTLDTGSYPAANRTPFVIADDLFAAGTRKICALPGPRRSWRAPAPAPTAESAAASGSPSR
jgi:hypothetical protein